MEEQEGVGGKLCHHEDFVRQVANNRYLPNERGRAGGQAGAACGGQLVECVGLKSSHWKAFTVQLNIFTEGRQEIIRHRLFVLLTLSSCPCQ